MNEETLFHEARQMPVGERTAFLEEACGDASLRARVESLLQADDNPDSLLEPKPPATSAISSLSEAPGQMIGSYKLLRQIGEGGMGTVFMAEQTEPIERKVALKIIKPGMDSRQVIARFQAERQALALMDHPHIAKMLDAGTTENGRPYFVMELVQGVSITSYCDQHRLRTKERLNLFISVCSAVQHAHQKGIIHRDLKPNNVLVADYDDRPVAKIIDFGVAKAVGQPLTERTMFTEFGQVLGTIEYMSPEQAKLNQLDIDTRTDIYSLGVLLYELLAGSTPFDKERLRSAAFDEMLRIIREEEPVNPSTRLSTSLALPSIAANRQLEPKKLTTLVRGDLDWIVMKSLEKARTRRYETATGLAEDIQRYLTDQPVEARRPTRGYRLKKFIRRNKVGVLMGVTIMAATVAAFAMLIVSDVRIRRASAAKDAALATARQAVDQMLTRTADEKLLDVPLAQPVRRALLEDALKFYQGFISQAVSDPSLRIETARVLQKIGDLQRDLGRYDDSRHSYEHSVSVLEGLTAEAPTEYTYRQELALAEQAIAYLLQRIGNDKEAESHDNKGLQVFTDLERDFPDRRQPVLGVLGQLGDIQNGRGNTRAAERLWQEAIHRGELYLDQTPGDIDARVSLCWLYHHIAVLGFYDRGQYGRQCEEYLKNGIRHSSVMLQKDPDFSPALHADAMTRAVLAQRYCRFQRFDEAVSLLRQAVQEYDKICSAAPANHNYWHDVIWLHQLIADELGAAGRNEELTESVRRSYDWLKAIAPHVPENAEPQDDLLQAQVQILMMLRDTDQADEAAEFARTISTRSSQSAADAECNMRRSVWLGFGCALSGDWDHARALIEDATKCHAVDGDILQSVVFRGLATDPHLLPADADEEPRQRFYSALVDFVNETAKNTNNAGPLNAIAWRLVTSRNVGKTAANLAVTLARKGTEIAPSDGNIANTLGVAQYRAGNWQAAVTALNKSIELQHGGDAHDYLFLAMTLQRLDKPDEARKWYDKAFEWMDKNDPKDEQLRGFHTEAAELLGITEPKSSADSKSPDHQPATTNNPTPASPPKTEP